MLQLQNKNELLEAQIEREDTELIVSMCEQVIQEERVDEYLDVDRQIIPGFRQEQSCTVHIFILPNVASLDKACRIYIFR